MIKLYFAPMTRSVRVLWLLEELSLPYTLERVDFLPPEKKFFAQATPTGKLPTLDDDGVVMCESGAILEYLLERYGDGRLAPARGTPERAAFLQWMHFSESTVFPPLGIVIWLTRYRDAAELPSELIADARSRAASGLDYVEQALGDRPYLVGSDFSAADIMMGFSLVAAKVVGVLDDRYPVIDRYLARLQERPAFKKAAATE